MPRRGHPLPPSQTSIGGGKEGRKGREGVNNVKRGTHFLRVRVVPLGAFTDELQMFSKYEPWVSCSHWFTGWLLVMAKPSHVVETRYSFISRPAEVHEDTMAEPPPEVGRHWPMGNECDWQPEVHEESVQVFWVKVPLGLGGVGGVGGVGPGGLGGVGPDPDTTEVQGDWFRRHWFDP